MILRNGYVFDRETTDILGTPEAGCGGGKITLEDLKTKALWVDINPMADSDVVADLNDPRLYIGILETQGPSSLKKVSERTWETANVVPETFGFIKKLLGEDFVYQNCDLVRKTPIFTKS